MATQTLSWSQRIGKLYATPSLQLTRAQMLEVEALRAKQQEPEQLVQSYPDFTKPASSLNAASTT
jgi:hypothetical protein